MSRFKAGSFFIAGVFVGVLACFLSLRHHNGSIVRSKSLVGPAKSPSTGHDELSRMSRSSGIVITSEARPTSGRYQSLEVLADLQKRKLIKFTTPLLDREGKLTKAFSELFELTPEEMSRVQQSFDRARYELAAQAEQRAQVRVLSDGKVVIAVPPFPSEGGKVYDELNQSLGGVLGDERNSYFAALLDDQMELTFGFFGAGDHTYTVGNAVDGRDGYSLEDKVVQRTQEGGTTGFTNNTRFESYDALASYVGPVVTMLPPDFKKLKRYGG